MSYKKSRNKHFQQQKALTFYNMSVIITVLRGTDFIQYTDVKTIREKITVNLNDFWVITYK